MSLDIDWTLLSSDGGSLRDSLLGTLNRALGSAKRPDFLGPISITHLELGSEGPQLDIVAIHDVWDEFRSLDTEGVAGVQEQQQQQPVVYHQGHPKRPPMQLPLPSQPRLQTYRQYSDENPQRVGADTAPSSVHPGMGMRAGSSFGSSVWGGGGGGGGGTPWGAAAGMGTGGVGLPTPSFAAAGAAGYFSHWQPSHHSHPSASSPPPPPDTARTFDAAAPTPTAAAGSSSAIPNLQLHASLVWGTASLRLSLATSLLINHPSPGFMSLPLSITATGLVLQAEVVLALEGDRKRVHLSLLPLDEGSAAAAAAANDDANTPDDAALPPPPPQPNTAGSGPPPTLGARLLPSMTFESSVGQADKQTLRNVGKVERFVLDLVRKGVEDEVRLCGGGGWLPVVSADTLPFALPPSQLVFPSFYTIDLNR